MRVLVATCAHRGDDARIVQRQAIALTDAGHEVVLVAPAPSPRGPIVHLVVPRARGRRRLRSWFAVTREVRRHRDASVLIVHDLELLVPLAFVRRLPPLVVDVHEDLAASVTDRSWLPRPARRLAALFVDRLESRAARIGTVIAAEHSYRDRLGDVPVVPNSTPVPASCRPREAGSRRVVYIGRISRSRGWDEMLACARRLRDRVELHLWGEPDADVREEVMRASEAGEVTWHGYVDNRAALAAVEGAAMGLSLLADLPNYRRSMPTKVAEYLARGVPVVASDLPATRAVLDASNAGILVAPGDVDAACSAITALLDDERLADDMARRGREHARAHLDWNRDAVSFVSIITAAAR
jgi:glycosyltransferase involved in cell wall biosynthesis